VILRRNVGLDFASWKDAVRSTSALGGIDRLLLTNDSVFGPFRDLGPFFERAEREPASIWGMTDGHSQNMGGYHLQSWFLDIPRETLRSGTFRRFWRRLVPITDKWSIICRYEVKLSRRILDSGGTIRAAFPSAETVAVARSKGESFQFAREFREAEVIDGGFVGLNPMLKAWDILIRDLGCPFIKTSVLKEDLYKSDAVDHWPDLIPAESRWLVDVIIRFLRRAYPDSAGLRCSVKGFVKLNSLDKD